MTMPAIVTIGRAVTQILTDKAAGGTPFATAVVVKFAYLPVYELADLTTAVLTVVPKALESELASRIGLDRHFHIDVALQCKTTADGAEADGQLDTLMALVGAVDDFIRATSLPDLDDVTWVGSTNNPIYSVEHLRKGVFTSVLTLTYRVIGGGS